MTFGQKPDFPEPGDTFETVCGNFDDLEPVESDEDLEEDDDRYGPAPAQEVAVLL